MYYCVLLCITVYYCVLLCITVYHCVLLCITVYYCVLLCITVYYCVLLCITVYYCVLRCITAYYCVLLCITVWYTKQGASFGGKWKKHPPVSNRFLSWTTSTLTLIDNLWFWVVFEWDSNIKKEMFWIWKKIRNEKKCAGSALTCVLNFSKSKHPLFYVWKNIEKLD